MVNERDAADRNLRDIAAGGSRLRPPERGRPGEGSSSHSPVHADFRPSSTPDIRGEFPLGRCGSPPDRSDSGGRDDDRSADGLSFLAHAGGGPAIPSAAGSHDPRDRHGPSSDSLSDDAGCCILASSAAPRGRNLATPKAIGSGRQRSVLVHFIATIEPERCEALADQLLAAFHSISRIWAQSPEALARVIGDAPQVAEVILEARKLAAESFSGDLRGISIDPFDRRLRSYLIMSMGSLSDERLRILFLDGGRHLLADEVLQSGTLAQLAIYPRTIFRRALELNAAGLILVHNHPSGDHRPSVEDIEATRKLEMIGRSLNVEIIDHIVVTSTHCHHVISNDTLAGTPIPSASFTLRSPGGPARIDHGDIALANARAAMRRRLLRQQLIGTPELFGDPAWEMLIDLFVHECERKRLSISALCVTSSIPMSSALRLAQRLCDAGITRRVPDPIDGRRTFIRLDPVIAHRMRAYFEAGAE
ncbi:hypothetical protein E5675_01990 [Sphingopyxis sp. PAMC25046]|nr:hypothetical protein E5675_01990 [Sphingopyxis sp. PAMC25046]